MTRYDEYFKIITFTICMTILLATLGKVLLYGAELPVEVTKPRHHRTLTLDMVKTIRGVPVVDLADKTPMPKPLVKVESVFSELEEKATVEKSSVVQPHYGDK